MTKRRFHAPGFTANTRGHSVLSRSGYTAAPRRVYTDSFNPEYIPRRLGYENTAEEYSIGSAVTNATYFSDNVLYDTYDNSSKSRGRDAKLLQDATAAIVSSEAHATPRASVASRRVARKVVYSAPAKPLPSTRRIEAAIVASKVEIEPRRKHPKSKFAAEKLRATRRPGEEAVYSQSTAGLHASRPTMGSRAGYRMESRVDPTDIIYKPGSFNRMREQVRGAHDKLDRHRQLLDRYMVEPGESSDVAARVLRKTEELERRNPSYRSTRRK